MRGPFTTAARLTLVVFAAALAATGCGVSGGGDECGDNAACAESPTAEVPEEFLDACGKPGSTVEVRSRSVTISHDECDLTGVTLTRNGAGAVVPPAGQGVGNSSGITIETDAATGDVTFTAES